MEKDNKDKQCKEESWRERRAENKKEVLFGCVLFIAHMHCAIAHMHCALKSGTGEN